MFFIKSMFSWTQWIARDVVVVNDQRIKSTKCSQAWQAYFFFPCLVLLNFVLNLYLCSIVNISEVPMRSGGENSMSTEAADEYSARRSSSLIDSTCTLQFYIKPLDKLVSVYVRDCQLVM